MDEMVVVRIEVVMERKNGERECRYLSGKEAEQEVVALSKAQMYSSISNMTRNWKKTYSSPTSPGFSEK